MNEFFLRMNIEELEQILMNEVSLSPPSEASKQISSRILPLHFKAFSLDFKLALKQTLDPTQKKNKLFDQISEETLQTIKTTASLAELNEVLGVLIS